MQFMNERQIVLCVLSSKKPCGCFLVSLLSLNTNKCIHTYICIDIHKCINICMYVCIFIYNILLYIFQGRSQLGKAGGGLNVHSGEDA